MKKNKLVVFFSIIFSLLIVEIICSQIIFKKGNYNFKNAYMLFSEGKVFKNIDNFFTYEPNKKITASNYYFNGEEFVEVYKYNLTTNNLGLVQKKDIFKNIPSILILGDSFTEGQGAEAWIDNFDGKYKDYQIINGGLLATGFKQFELLDTYLSNFNIQKVFILFIGDDLRRNIFNFNDQQLKCLSDQNQCLGTEIFYGFDYLDGNQNIFLSDIRKKQLKNQKKNNITFKKIRRDIKRYIADLYIVKIPLDLIRSKFYRSKNVKILENFESINRLSSKYKDNLFFVHLKTKHEIMFKKKNYESVYAENYIKKISTNYYECNFNENLENFYELDGHPNSKGYQNLFNCISNLFKETIN